MCYFFCNWRNKVCSGRYKTLCINRFYYQTLSTQDNAKLLEQTKSGFERAISWNKFQLKESIERPNEYLHYLVDPNFQVVNRLSVLSFENNANRTRHTGYFLPKVEVTVYDVMIDGQNAFDQLVKNYLRK